MKNYKLYNPGDRVIIIRSHSDDKGKEGIIVEVRNSFCKINIGTNPQNGKSLIKNHTYGQFKKLV